MTSAGIGTLSSSKRKSASAAKASPRRKDRRTLHAAERASGKAAGTGRIGSGKPAAAEPLSVKTPRAATGMAPLPDLRRTLSVIISAKNEAATLPGLLKQVERLQPAEIIIVLNGCSDNSYEQARLCRQATIVHCPEPAGHDVGRALGAKLSRGDILLFLDGDMAIPAEQLAVFAAAVDGGVDVALNDLSGLLPPFGLSDDVTRCKLYLNAVLGRSDLGGSSLTAVPHAMSRRAVELVGFRELMVPPKAQALSLLKGLRVEKAGTVNVIKHNRLRQSNIGAGNAVERLIAGDHAEALAEVLSRREAAGLLSGDSLREQRRRLAAWRNSI